MASYTAGQIGEPRLRPIARRTKDRYEVWVRQDDGYFRPVVVGTDWQGGRDRAHAMIRAGVDWTDVWGDIVPAGVEAPADGWDGQDHTWGNARHHLWWTARDEENWRIEQEAAA